MKEIASFFYNDEKIECIKFFLDEADERICMHIIMKSNKHALLVYNVVTTILKLNKGFNKETPINFKIILKGENVLSLIGDIQRAIQLLVQEKLFNQAISLKL